MSWFVLPGFWKMAVGLGFIQSLLGNWNMPLQSGKVFRGYFLYAPYEKPGKGFLSKGDGNTKSIQHKRGLG